MVPSPTRRAAAFAALCALLTFALGTAGSFPYHPVFDGSNIWVPNLFGNSVTVVRASSGAILQTLTGNGLGGPSAAAFDGQRILIERVGARA